MRTPGWSGVVGLAALLASSCGDDDGPAGRDGGSTGLTDAGSALDAEADQEDAASEPGDDAGVSSPDGGVSSPALPDGPGFYVRPDGANYGRGDGSSWTDAWSGFSTIEWGAVSCGDVIWVAGGDHTEELRPDVHCTEGAGFYILRARADAPGATLSDGWSADLDSTVHQVGAGISFDGDWDHVTISGRTTSDGGAHGWWIDLSEETEGTGVSFSNDAEADFNTVEYMDIQGPGYVTYTDDGRGIDATPFSSATGNTFRHLRLFDWESTIYLAGISDTTFEYMEVYGVAAENSADFHPNGLYTSDADGLIVRYSEFHDDAAGNGIGEGIFCEQQGGCAGWRIYGNVFHDLSSKVIQITSSVDSVGIFNNTFANVSYAPIQVRTDQGGACAGESATRNNIFHASAGFDDCGEMSNNLESAAPDPFIDGAGGDFHIVGTVGDGFPRDAGLDLSDFFTTDVSGAEFGADGAWDMGAYEY